GDTVCDARHLISGGWQCSHWKQSGLFGCPECLAHPCNGGIEGRTGQIECRDRPSKRRSLGRAIENAPRDVRNAAKERVDYMSRRRRDPKVLGPLPVFDHPGLMHRDISAVETIVADVGTEPQKFVEEIRRVGLVWSRWADQGRTIVQVPRRAAPPLTC